MGKLVELAGTKYVYKGQDANGAPILEPFIAKITHSQSAQNAMPSAGHGLPTNMQLASQSTPAVNQSILQTNPGQMVRPYPTKITKTWSRTIISLPESGPMA